MYIGKSKGGRALADKAKSANRRTVAYNRKARHDYFVEDTFEAGLSLFGTEVKSVRNGAVNLKDSFCYVKDGEIFAVGLRISPYEKGNIFNRDPMREKKLLMHKKEILKLSQYITRDSYTLVPLSLYFSGSKVKLELGLCKGKKLYDKRDDIAKRDAKRDIERSMKERY